VTKEGFSTGNVIISNTRHLEALNAAAANLNQALANLQNKTTGDFIAMDIRQSLHQIGTITGDIGVEDLLDNIFSKFCIGK
jgi:tRNA modification GTPase